MTRWSQADLDAYMARLKVDSIKADTDPADAGPESKLQAKAQKWLDDHGFPWVHDRSRKKNRPGQILDLYCFLPAGRLEIFEFKSGSGVLRDKQKETIRQLLFLGHRVHKCTSFRYFLDICEQKNEI